MSGRASLNHVYRTVWNQALGAMVAVAEIATSGGRSACASRSRTVQPAVDIAQPPLRAISLSILVALIASNSYAQTLPTGGVAVHGGAAFNTSQPNRLTVTTTNGAGSNHSAINWNSFSIGSGNTANFVQPNAASLSINRVVTNTPSQLFGTLSSNGKLVLVNQSGIAVGAGAVVDTAGFTASALAMSEADAIAGRLRFGGGSSAGLTVDGNIIARGGDLVLIAPNVDVAKTAVVESQGGSVVLAAGQSVEVTGRGLEGITLQLQAPTDQAVNLGTLKGDAVGIFAGTLRHSGMIQAVQANMEGGKVVLRAVGDAYVEGQGQINAAGAVGKGGSVDVLGNRVAIAGQSLIDVSGQQGGGSIRVGGDFQGKNAAVQNADRTYLGADATLKADALDSGAGGRVIVWADQQTQGHGTITARGGAQGGDGGFVEVSGKQNLAFTANVNTLAPKGRAGILLLDPLNIDVSIGGSTPLTSVDQFIDLPGITAVVTPAVLNSATSNVVLQATENIDFNNAVAMTNPGIGLTAQAGGVISVQAPISTTGGNVSLYANAPGSGGPGSGGSAVYVNAPINSNGGSITLRSDSSDVGGNSVVLAANVNAGAGSITLLAPFDRIQQTAGALTGASLSATADYTIDLNQPGNNIPGSVTLSSNTSTASGSSLTFNNTAASFNLIEATSKGTVVINTAGSLATSGSPITSAIGSISITAPTGMSLNSNITANGLVFLTSNTSGNITQTGGFINAGGLTSASAAFGSVNLGQSSNDFQGGIQVFGNDLTVRNANALTVSALSNGTSGNVSFTAGGVLTMLFGINIATTGDIALISGGSFTQQSTLSGTNIALESNGPMTLSQNITATGTLTLNDIATGGGGIGQTAGAITAAGLTTVSTSGNITLNQPGNDFSSITANGSLASLTDSNALVLNTLVVSGLNVQTNNGLVSQSSGSFLVSTGTTNFQTGSGDVILNNGGNIFGTLNANTTGTVSVTNALTPVTLGSVSAGSFTLLSGSAIDSTSTSTITTITGGIDIQTTSGGIDFFNTAPILIFSATGIKLQGTGSVDLSGAAIDVSTVSSGDLVIASSTGLLIAPGVDLTFNNGGRWLTYLLSTPGHVYGPNFDPITNANFRQFNAPIGATPLGTGNGNLFAIAPTILGTLTGSVTKVFDGNALISLAGTGLTGVVGTLFGETVTPPGALGLTGTLTNGPNVQGPFSQVGVIGTPLAGVSVPGTPATPTYGYQYSFSGNIGSVTAAPITITPATVSPISLSGIRAYDGTVIADARIFTLSGLQGSDTLSLSGFGLFADRNVGVNKAVSLNTLNLGNGPTGGLASNYTFTGGNFAATITPAPLGGTVNVMASNKVYDGLTAATLAGSTSGLTGLIQGDVVTLVGLSGDFSDRHVGTGKAITVNGVSLGGTHGGNYTFAGAVGSASADITQRPTSTWTGAGGNTQWSNPGNWDALPDRNNVAAVSIPAGTGRVIFDASVDPTTLQSLTSGQTLAMSGGSLAVNSDLNLPGFAQTGGTLKGVSNLNVSNSFSQTGGSLQLGRDLAINQTSGNLVVGDIAARRVKLNAPTGSISQSAGMLADVLVAEAATGLAFTSATNKISSAELTNTGSGTIAFTNSIPMEIAGIRSADGDVTVNNTGGLFTTSLINVPRGKLSIIANSPLRIGGDGIVAGGDVNLTATNLTSPGDITIDGPIVSGGAVRMDAANSLTQNDVIFGADGVTATASSFSFGPRAVSGRAPVAYSVGGVAVRPPPSGAQARAEGRLAPDAVIDFIQRLERAQRQQLDDVVSIATGDGLPGRRRDRDAVTTEGNVCRR